MFKPACWLCVMLYNPDMQQDMTKPFPIAQFPHSRQSGVWHYLQSLAHYLDLHQAALIMHLLSTAILDGVKALGGSGTTCVHALLALMS